jgi:hypothetical protein
VTQPAVSRQKACEAAGERTRVLSRGGSGAAIHVVIQRAYTWIGEQIANNDGVYSVLRAP